MSATELKLYRAFCDADDAFNLYQKQKFGCETGPDRHCDARWDVRMIGLWRARQRARRAWRMMEAVS